jgi:hypothetical protein
MKHKHADLIKAWADGAEIQVFYNDIMTWGGVDKPDWHESLSYRIKPKPPVVRWLWAKEHIGGEWMISPVFRSKEEALKTFDGQVICLEYTRTEFPE